MRSVDVIPTENESATDLAKSRCGGSAKPADYEPPAHRKTMLSSLLNSAKEAEYDQCLAYLAVLFDQVTLDDSEYSEDSDGSSEYDSDSGGEPCSKDYYETKYYFSTSRGSFYFDSLQNVYSEDGTLIHDSSFGILTNGLFDPTFHIDGVPYWFDGDRLMSQDNYGIRYAVQTWESEPDVFDLIQYLNQPITSMDDPTLPPNMNAQSYYDVPSFGGQRGSSTVEHLTDGLQVPLNTNMSSSQAFQAKGGKFVLSPTSSTAKSPIVSAASRSASEEPSLFHSTQPGQAQGISIVFAWQKEMQQAQQAAARARPVTKPTKEHRWRCPTCNKPFRRPGSLEDHLNVHSGEKPHICPFEDCKTGFAAKSNMKRHFLTHQVGPLESYRPGMTYKPDATQSAKASRPAIATYNSKAHHNGRFRITIQDSL